MIGAFAYLIGTSTRNRFRAQLLRLKNPRYLIAAVVGVMYFFFVFWGRTQRSRPGTGSNPFLSPTVEAIAPLIVLLLVVGTWMFGGDRTALAFTEAEVSMLFTAPVTRRALLLYKLVRSQVTIFVSVIIWSLILRRGSTALPALASALAYWALFTTLSLHKLGATLVRSATMQYGKSGARRNWMSIGILLLVVALVFVQLGTANGDLSGDNPFEFMNKLTAYLTSGPMAIALYPFRLVVSPLFAHDLSHWARAMLPAIAIMGGLAVWVLQTDTAFEEAAATASVERAKTIARMRQRGPAAPVVKQGTKLRTIRLAATGAPAVAIFWKNIVALMRASSSAVFILPLVVIGILAIAVPKGHGDTAQAIAFVAVFMSAFLVLLGARMFRNDLRSDMLHLPMLKTLPVSGADLVMAEVASGTVPLVALQLILLIVAFVAFGFSGNSLVAPNLRIAMLAAAPVVLLPLNAASFALMNGAAILFPGWIRLGPAGAGGVEAVGQQILTTFGTWFALLLMLIGPAAAVALSIFVSPTGGPMSMTIGALAGALILGAETYVLMRWLGEAFDRAEPSHVAA